MFSVVFLSYSHAYAIMIGSGPFVMPVAATIALGEVITTIALLICVPMALGGFLLRLLGFQKEGEGSGWQWHFEQAVEKLLRYFSYHFLLFGGLAVIAKIVQSANCNLDSFCVSYNTGNPFNVLFTFIHASLTDFATIAAFLIILALAWTYFVYRVRRNFDPLVIRPGVGSYLRLIFWNLLIVFIVTFAVAYFRVF